MVRELHRRQQRSLQSAWCSRPTTTTATRGAATTATGTGTLRSLHQRRPSINDEPDDEQCVAFIANHLVRPDDLHNGHVIEFHPDIDIDTVVIFHRGAVYRCEQQSYVRGEYLNPVAYHDTVDITGYYDDGERAADRDDPGD
jgi:hypothetical protein